ncbi:HBR444Cp [Eremothecium sinecaudum]|uniref:HBR444Cp n=1 Tax=Eremothecium sinecaudum TaxID=45286 RepID=A0A109UVJ6_9SACH|nr:HBR444Cp [Eremothecium sinecaudum]AMD19345.1 HBR444Cp [Eremothecium sinecaudum]
MRMLGLHPANAKDRPASNTEMELFWNVISRRSTVENGNASTAKSTAREKEPQPLNNVDSQAKVKPTIQYPRLIEYKCGESLAIRTNILQRECASTVDNFGVPDLVHVTEYDSIHHHNIGEHHYITGIDVSSEAMPIAYLNTLRLNRESSKEHRRVSMYCTFNIFSRVDIRIRFESEKNYQINIINVKGEEELKLSERLWDETFVSGCIRSIVINRDRNRKVPGLVEYPIGRDAGHLYCQKVITGLCKFIPRAIEAGYDPALYDSPSYLQNYVVDTLSHFLSMSQHVMYDFTIKLLDRLAAEDSENEVQYRLVQSKIALESHAHEVTSVKLIHDGINKFFPNITKLSQTQLRDLVDFLNMQVKFLIRKADFKLALPIADRAVSIAPNSFIAWHNLAVCHLELAHYDKVLGAISSMPHLAFPTLVETALADVIERNYYKKPLGAEPTSNLFPRELTYVTDTFTDMNSLELRTLIYGRTVMSKPTDHGGYLQEIWNGPCKILGPIYGVRSCNIINFVSEAEVNAINHMEFLERNKLANSLSPSEAEVYTLLMRIIQEIGWYEFLELRLRTFVTKQEYSEHSQVIPTELKSKRICGTWLEKLVMHIYHDLEACLHIDLNSSEMKNSALEWQLIGLTLVRIGNYDDAIACLKTCLSARFDIITAEALLKLYIDGHYSEQDIDIIIDLVIRTCAYALRFYDRCQWLTMRALAKLCDQHTKEIITSRIQVCCVENNGMISLLERFLNQIYQD